jgi:hypothetical protein
MIATIFDLTLKGTSLLSLKQHFENPLRMRLAALRAASRILIPVHKSVTTMFVN